MRVLRTFSFTSEDQDILEHIDKKKNKSKYIKDLVRKDMQEQKLPSELRKIINKYILDNIERFK